jgi:hypothetical protein
VTEPEYDPASSPSASSHREDPTSDVLDGAQLPPPKRDRPPDLLDDPVIQDAIRRLDLLNQATNLRLRTEADLQLAREAQARGDSEAMWQYLHRADRMIGTALRLQDKASEGLVPAEETSRPERMPQPFLDSLCRYRGLLGGPAHCRLRIFEVPGEAPVVIATELPDNPGTSVTNFAEHLATAVWHLLERPPAGLTWIEHYPPQETGTRREESFALVLFTQIDGRYYGPRWRHVTREEVETLIGGALDQGRPA